MTEPVPLLTVGHLKSELSRWSSETPVIFYSPLREQEFRFYRYRPGDTVLSLRSMNFQRHRRWCSRAPSGFNRRRLAGKKTANPRARG